MSAFEVTMKDLKEKGTYQTERREFKRGEVWMVDFGGKESKLQGEIAGYRPVVIIQNNAGNKYSSNIIVSAITSSIVKVSKNLITHVPVELDRPSIVQTELVNTINKERFCKYVCTLTEEEMIEIEYKLLISLGMTWVHR